MLDDPVNSLPVYPFLDEITAVLAGDKCLILTAEPGAGKTTLVPWHLLKKNIFGSRRIVLLEPRRVAARAAADRISFLLGGKIGVSVGLRTRRETIISGNERLVVMTEGILVRMLQRDPSLEGYSAVIFDEFHERSLMADLALALALDARENLRPDLSILVMSATLPPMGYGPLEGARKISVPGRVHPVEVSYMAPRGNEKMWDGAARLAAEAFRRAPEGHVLVFLPGWREIMRTKESIERSSDVRAGSIVILHGSLPPDEQRRIIGYRGDRKMIILSTNVAETSITIPGVAAVVDTCHERRVAFSPRTGMDHRDTVRVSAASEEQRRGRAGRTGPGLCIRWREQDDIPAAFTPPEILRADLSSLLLEISAWGARSAADLRWIDNPPAASLERAAGLLALLGLADENRNITEDGKAAVSMGLHPRAARIVIESKRSGLIQTAAACVALIEEGDNFLRDEPDFSVRLDEFKKNVTAGQGRIYGTAAVIAAEAERILRFSFSGKSFNPAEIEPGRAGTALLPGYPDMTAGLPDSGGRAGRRLFPGGRGAFAPAVFSSRDFVVAVETDGGETDARIFCGARVGREEIEEAFPHDRKSEIIIKWNGWKPVVREREKIMGLVVKEGPGEASRDRILDAARDRISREGPDSLPWDESARGFISRCAYFLREIYPGDERLFSVGRLAAEADAWLFPFASFHGGEIFNPESMIKGLEFRLGYDRLRELNKAAPAKIKLPTGSERPLDYSSGDVPVLRVKIQELFGTDVTPAVCGKPVVMELLSPAGRPVQVTRDLAGFWNGSYAEVKKEMAGRYPKHRWPDDPLNEKPSLKTKKQFRERD